MVITNLDAIQGLEEALNPNLVQSHAEPPASILSYFMIQKPQNINIVKRS
jgi:hypothetical protein